MAGNELVRIKFSQFFDRKPVIAATSRATRQALSKAGGTVRKIAQRSLRKAPYETRKPRGEARTDFRTEVSQPGKPPYSREGSLKKWILYGYEADTESVVIGPAATYTGVNQTPGAPEALEFGGTVLRKGKTFRYRARPFMGPALKKAVDSGSILNVWKGAIK